jgi:hypothetical protein
MADILININTNPSDFRTMVPCIVVMWILSYDTNNYNGLQNNIIIWSRLITLIVLNNDYNYSDYFLINLQICASMFQCLHSSFIHMVTSGERHHI